MFHIYGIIHYKLFLQNHLKIMLSLNHKNKEQMPLVRGVATLGKKIM